MDGKVWVNNGGEYQLVDQEDQDTGTLVVTWGYWMDPLYATKNFVYQLFKQRGVQPGSMILIVGSTPDDGYEICDGTGGNPDLTSFAPSGYNFQIKK